MLDLGAVDLDALAVALADQSALDHTWMLDPRTGEVAPWTEAEGIDGDPVDPDEVGLVAIEAVPSAAWHRDLADFAGGISDQRVARRLTESLTGRGAFRRFAGVLDRYPTHLTAYLAFRDARGRRRAVQWLADAGLVDPVAADRWLAEHPDPPLP